MADDSFARGLVGYDGGESISSAKQSETSTPDGEKMMWKANETWTTKNEFSFRFFVCSLLYSNLANVRPKKFSISLSSILDFSSNT